MSKNSDMPAMPIFNDYGVPTDLDGAKRDNFSCGLTKREHFAGLALQEITAAYPKFEATDVDKLCELCVDMADALLEALEAE